ncbi:MAG: DUF4157 domain-containing protein [Streptosporangiaceae bacterium]
MSEHVFPATAEVLRRQVADRRPVSEALAVLEVVGKGSGQALTPELRAEMESRLGANFSHVRVHTDAKAAESAASVSARAYTVGNEIVFGRNSFVPDDREGKHRLAHELIHVQQQRLRPVAGADVRSGIAVSDPSDHFEREAKAKASQAMSDSPSTTASGVRSSAGEATGALSHQAMPTGRATVQRDHDPNLDAPSEPQRPPAWRTYFQAALQGVTGTTPSQKAKEAKAIADTAQVYATWRGHILGRLIDTLPDDHDKISLNLAFNIDDQNTGRSDWAPSFNSALQVTSAKGGSPMARVEGAAQIADQAVLVMGNIPKNLWQKYIDAVKEAHKAEVAMAKSAPAKSAPGKPAPAKSAPKP